MISKEERMAMDAQMEGPSGSGGGGRSGRSSGGGDPENPDDHASRPGDPGWCYRARVPQVNASSYTNRPEWQSLEDITGKSMKQTSRLEKHIRNAQNRKQQAKNPNKRAIEISVEGRKMAI